MFWGFCLLRWFVLSFFYLFSSFCSCFLHSCSLSSDHFLPGWGFLLVTSHDVLIPPTVCHSVSASPLYISSCTVPRRAPYPPQGNPLYPPLSSLPEGFGSFLSEPALCPILVIRILRPRLHLSLHIHLSIRILCPWLVQFILVFPPSLVHDWPQASAWSIPPPDSSS